MNIYVETNFLQELAFLQEQSGACEDILKLCESGAAQLVIPAFSLAEPLEKLHRQKNTRLEIQKSVDTEIKQLSRTVGYESQIQNIKNLDLLFAQSIEEERKRFEKYLNKLVDIAYILPLDAPIFQASEKFERELKLSMQDALVYASVLTHLRADQTSTSCFLNRNSKDFDIPEIRTQLAGLNCTMIPRFDDGFRFVTSRLNL